ncbi:hypothetical protein DID73_00010 [Candidatus Marinamargulisbacteria bacterium SCGC AG-343-K17]|nr:hypothetical protein DID73_00010 [Candidatus Marinamargulisbacteria bacterium SCGC AG-343-K17]
MYKTLAGASIEKKFNHMGTTTGHRLKTFKGHVEGGAKFEGECKEVNRIKRQRFETRDGSTFFNLHKEGDVIHADKVVKKNGVYIGYHFEKGVETYNKFTNVDGSIFFNVWAKGNVVKCERLEKCDGSTFLKWVKEGNVMTCGVLKMKNGDKLEGWRKEGAVETCNKYTVYDSGKTYKGWWKANGINNLRHLIFLNLSNETPMHISIK